MLKLHSLIDVPTHRLHHKLDEVKSHNWNGTPLSPEGTEVFELGKLISLGYGLTHELIYSPSVITRDQGSKDLLGNPEGYIKRLNAENKQAQSKGYRADSQQRFLGFLNPQRP